jgi:hypothetical protein
MISVAIVWLGSIAILVDALARAPQLEWHP